MQETLLLRQPPTKATRPSPWDGNRAHRSKEFGAVDSLQETGLVDTTGSTWRPTQRSTVFRFVCPRLRILFPSMASTHIGLALASLGGFSCGRSMFRRAPKHPKKIAALRKH